MNQPSFSLSAATLLWLKIGCLSFGGPAGQIALMHHEVVEKRQLISEERFLNALNFCMLLPGPEAQQLAIYLGWILHSKRGGLIAGLLFVLPAFALMLGLSFLYLNFEGTPFFIGIFAMIKPVVLAVMLHALWKIGQRTLKRRPLAWLLAAISLVSVAFFHVSFPWVLGVSLLATLLCHRRLHAWFGIEKSAISGSGADVAPSKTIDFSWTKWLLMLVSGLAIWAGSFFLIVFSCGKERYLQDMAGFFSKAAVLTFGGAYAVLPYVKIAAVDQCQWLQAGQMMDGLALGESTPGPLILIVAFVGFLGGVSQESMGNPWLAGVIAASVASWFTFLPSFLFIFAGAPLLEKFHQNPIWSVVMRVVGMVVIGQIAHLILFFGQHVCFSNHHFSWQNALVALIAWVLLHHFKRSVLEVVLAGAALGLLSTLFSTCFHA